MRALIRIIKSHNSIHLHTAVHVSSYIPAHILIVHLFDNAKGLPVSGLLATTLEPHLLDVSDLLVESLVFEAVSIDLCLVILEFSNHVLQLLSSLLKVLLINLELFSDLRARLLGQNVLKLNVKLFFLLNEDVLLTDLLGFRNQTLLETLNLLDELISLRVGTL